MLELNRDIAERIKLVKVILLGCSAGGFQLTFELLSKLPSGFPLPVIVIIHRSPKYKSAVEDILNDKGNLPVRLAMDKEKMVKGIIYFAPPDYHLLIEPNGELTLDYSEPVHYCRPSIDISFESFSDVYTKDVLAILLSGANEDGAEGMDYVSRAGGITVVQDPDSAEVKIMPEAAISRTNIDLILKDQEIFELMDAITNLKSHIS
ncbi:MAG: chemotaxis protein CheB [Bacteroidota bacterium]